MAHAAGKLLYYAAGALFLLLLVDDHVGCRLGSRYHLVADGGRRCRLRGRPSLAGRPLRRTRRTVLVGRGVPAAAAATLLRRFRSVWLALELRRLSKRGKRKDLEKWAQQGYFEVMGIHRALSQRRPPLCCHRFPPGDCCPLVRYRSAGSDRQ